MRDLKSAGNMLLAVLLTLTAATGITACLDSSSSDPPPDSGALTITTGSPLPNGFVGIPYSLQLAISGGKPAYTWSLVTGSPALPNGLTLNPAGLISGTPTTQQSVTPKFSVQDSSLPAPQVVGKQLSITIVQVPQPTITTPSPLPSGIVGTPYPSTPLTATGGTPPYTFAQIVNGSFPALPSGLTFDAATATIRGAPAPGTAGTTNHQFSVTDSFSPTPQSSTKNFALTISNAPMPLTITTASLPPGTVAVTYPSTPLAASGGTPPYFWSIIAGGSTPAPGLILSSGGVISGTPANDNGSPFTRTYQVRDSAVPPQTETKPLSITVGLPAALNITATPLQNGVLNQFYSQTVQATGGSGTRNWSFQGGNIPNLAINQLTGVISGNPTPTGQFTFTVQVTDALFTDTQDFTITIIAPPAPQITTSSLPTGTVNVPYPSTTLTATGGAPPLIWQPVGMPFGLTFTAATATISGSPTSNGTQNVTFNVNDSTVPFNQTGTRTLSLTVNAEVTIDTTSPLPAGTVGQPYTPVQLVASGGAPPYTWSITGTGQPDQAAPGLTLSLDGVIGGGGQTPTTADSFTRTYRVEDSNGVPFTKSLTLNVNAALTINNTSLPAGQVNVDYGPVTLTASGGTPPYTWSTVTTPVLPADLIITPVGDTATISGKPTATETNMDHTFTVTDSTNFSVDKALSLTIDP